MKDDRQPEKYTVEGELDIDLQKFPQEILQKMITNPMGASPVLRIEIPSTFLQDGAVIETLRGGFRIKFTFAAFDIKIEEA